MKDIDGFLKSLIPGKFYQLSPGDLTAKEYDELIDEIIRHAGGIRINGNKSNWMAIYVNPQDGRVEITYTTKCDYVLFGNKINGEADFRDQNFKKGKSIDLATALAAGAGRHDHRHQPNLGTRYDHSKDYNDQTKATWINQNQTEITQEAPEKEECDEKQRMMDFFKTSTKDWK